MKINPLYWERWNKLTSLFSVTFNDIIPHKMPLAAVREQRLFLFEQDFTFNFSTIKGRVLVGINILTFCQKSVSSELKYLLLFPFKKLQN